MSDFKFCPKCGKKLPYGANFCTGCGHAFETPAPENPQESGKSIAAEKKRTPKKGAPRKPAIAILAAVLAFVAFSALGRLGSCAGGTQSSSNQDVAAAEEAASLVFDTVKNNSNPTFPAYLGNGQTLSTAKLTEYQNLVTNKYVSVGTALDDNWQTYKSLLAKKMSDFDYVFDESDAQVDESSGTKRVRLTVTFTTWNIGDCTTAALTASDSDANLNGIDAASNALSSGDSLLGSLLGGFIDYSKSQAASVGTNFLTCLQNSTRTYESEPLYIWVQEYDVDSWTVEDFQAEGSDDSFASIAACNVIDQMHGGFYSAIKAGNLGGDTN